MPKHSLGLGATTCPGSGVGKAGEKQIELINTPWLPPTPSWGKSTIYELTVLTQGEASQQYSSVCIASGFSFLTTWQLHRRPRGTSGLVGGARPWKQRGPGSDSSSVTLCPSMLFILYFSGHWALGLICLFISCRWGGGGNRKYFCQTPAGPDSIRKQSFAASKDQSWKESNWTSALLSSRGLTGGGRETLGPPQAHPFSGERRQAMHPMTFPRVRNWEEHCPGCVAESALAPACSL